MKRAAVYFVVSVCLVVLAGFWTPAEETGVGFSMARFFTVNVSAGVDKPTLPPSHVRITVKGTMDNPIITVEPWVVVVKRSVDPKITWTMDPQSTFGLKIQIPPEKFEPVNPTPINGTRFQYRKFEWIKTLPNGNLQSNDLSLSPQTPPGGPYPIEFSDLELKIIGFGETRMVTLDPGYRVEP